MKRSFRIWMAISSTRRIALSYGNGGSIGGSSRRTKIGLTELEPGRWYHVAGVISNEDDMTVYVNGIDDGGVLSGSATALTYSEGNGNSGRRGSGVNTDPIYFQGAMDDFAFYNSALTAEEITALLTFNNTPSTSPPRPAR